MYSLSIRGTLTQREERGCDPLGREQEMYCLLGLEREGKTEMSLAAHIAKGNAQRENR